MIKIWCDGAASHNGRADAIGGWGYVIQFSNEEPLMFGGKKNGATNQQMELVAMIQALYFAQGQLDRGEGEFVLPCEPIEVYTDSAYIANCYKQEWYKAWEINGWLNSKKEPVANKELWQLLIPFFRMHNIKIIKVKGHDSNLGNQLADKVAVAARLMEEYEFCNYRCELMKQYKGGIK